MNECSAYVGLDVHKDTIAVAVVLPGREEPVYRGEVKNQRKSLLRLTQANHPPGNPGRFKASHPAGPPSPARRGRPFVHSSLVSS